MPSRRVADMGEDMNSVKYAPKVLLHTAGLRIEALAPFVEKCLRDDVVIIATFGAGASDVEDLIEEIVVGDGSHDERFVTTSSHETESLDEVLSFLEAWCGEVVEVRLDSLHSVE